MANRKLIQAVEAYFSELRMVRASGTATYRRAFSLRAAGRPAHCLNKTVTQRKWLPQIGCCRTKRFT